MGSKLSLTKAESSVVQEHLSSSHTPAPTASLSSCIPPSCIYFPVFLLPWHLSYPASPSSITYPLYISLLLGEQMRLGRVLWPLARSIHQSEMLLKKLEERQIWPRSSIFGSILIFTIDRNPVIISPATFSFLVNIFIVRVQGGHFPLIPHADCRGKER